ncbi:MAG: hypothetical protein OQK76_09420 [Gammaproteobacteria bacterium]|nr:hypothetical protein [Gammaproteobacteria bacterium]MCW8910823.1 hypothetical protein [Gammaproteobacteria bacterium]MCW9006240.1 hypothetical protein [Gammaproteobacteria bacterium]MCW9055843.1 hypothetical protein [Gammaproteobacteria bacterium]
MKPVKIIGIAVVVLIIAILTAPVWGGCGFNYTLCSGWCEIKHFNSSFQSTSCKGGCGAEKLACLAK